MSFVQTLTAGAITVPLLAGCAMTERLASPINAGIEAHPLAKGEARWPAANWWQAYGSAEIDQLVTQALSANADIAIALGRVEQARGRARSAGALLLPAVQLEGSLQKSDSTPSAMTERWGAELTASYDVDLWGRSRAGRNAAHFALLASQFDHEAVRLMIVGDVLRNYASLMTVRERRTISQLNLEAARRLLARIEAMDRLGLALAGDLASQRALVAGEQASLAALDQAEGQFLASLALLVGQPASGFSVMGAGLGALAATQQVVPGLSSELLLRRPDIASAEANLASADADIRAARAAMLPSISLTAAYGVEGGSGLSNAFYNLVAGLTQPILDHGRLAGQRDTAMGVRIEREGAYRKAVLQAFAEVERDMTAIAGLDRMIAALEIQVSEASRAAAAADARFRLGVDEIIISLDAQRALYAARDRLVQARGERLAATISLQQVLGGGWAKGSIGS